MKKITIHIFTIALLSLVLISCSQTKNSEVKSTEQATYDALDLEPVYDDIAAIKINFDEKNVPDDTNGMVSEDDENVILKTGGIYVLKGTLKGKRVKVVEGLGDRIEIVLDGFNYEGDKDCVIYSPDKKCRVLIFLADASNNTISLDTSNYQSKEVKENAAIFAKGDLSFNGKGKLTVNTGSENSIECKKDLSFINGNYIFNSKHNGVKAKEKLLIRDGKMNIDAKGECLSGKTVDISGGNINLKSGDDGINANDKDQDKKANQKGVYARISGGMVTIDAAMDGIDSNGDLYLEGGEVFIYGSWNDGERIIDYNGTVTLNRGVLFCGTGPAAKMQDFGDSAKQNYIVMYFKDEASPFTLICINDENGDIIRHETKKSCKAALITSPKFETGKTYNIKLGIQSRELEFYKEIELKMKDGRNVVDVQ